MGTPRALGRADLMVGPMFDPTDHPRSADAYRLGATVAEVESCANPDELRDLVLYLLRERRDCQARADEKRRRELVS